MELCSSDSDSFENDNSFDKNFRRSTIGIDDDEVQIKDYRDESNMPYSRPSDKSYKKSSSLGEKCILELIPLSDDVGDQPGAAVAPPKLDIMVDHKLLLKTNKSQCDASNGNLSHGNSFDKADMPSTPTPKSLKPGLDLAGQYEEGKRPKKIVILEGLIKKITAWIIYKRRYLELSYSDDVPRLIYYTASRKTLRNEIALTRHTKATITGPSKFEIIDLENTYYFKDCGGNVKVKQWVGAINKAISNLTHKSTALVGSKSFSATIA